MTTRDKCGACKFTTSKGEETERLTKVFFLFLISIPSVASDNFTQSDWKKKQLEGVVAGFWLIRSTTSNVFVERKSE